MILLADTQAGNGASRVVLLLLWVSMLVKGTRGAAICAWRRLQERCRGQSGREWCWYTKRSTPLQVATTPLLSKLASGRGSTRSWSYPPRATVSLSNASLALFLLALVSTRWLE
jgi:hypothetical protein